MISHAFRGPGRAIRGPAASTGFTIAAASASAAISYPGWPAAGGTIGNPELVPILISSEAVEGRNRLLVTITDSTG